MKRFLSLSIVGGLITFIAVTLIAFSIWSFTRPVEPVVSETALPPIEPVVVVPTVDVQAQLSSLEATVEARGALYGEQLSTLQSLSAEREATYQAQLTEANSQLTRYQTAIEQYQQEIAQLTGQVSQLEQTLKERNATYQAQLEQSSVQLETRRTQLINQRDALQQALTEANTQSGR